VFFGVLLAHLLYDFHWQGPFISEFKGKSKFILFVHALTWTMFVSAVLWWFGALAPWKFALLLVSHLLVDGWKCRLPKTPEWFWAIYVDQGIHLLSLMAVSGP
jgi:hypothetical protein